MIHFKSVIPGVDWPALPNPRGCQLLALQFQLERSQWLSTDAIMHEQARLAYRLYQHAIMNIPFYRERYAEAGFSCDTLRGPEDWRRLPLLRRGDIQANFTQLQCRPTAHGKLSTSATTGSSGSPVIVVGTAVSRILWHALTLRHHLWHRRDFSGKLATIRALQRRSESLEEQQSNWGGATIDLIKTGPLVALDIHKSIDEQAHWLVRENPDYLLTYPSVAIALMEYMEREGMRLPRLRELSTFGELLEPRVRAICKRVWGVPLVDGYSSQEVGYIALQCPETEEYHVQAESVLVEVIDEDGNWCQPGEIGRVVITTLHNFAMPLIRYEIGDYAEVGQPCICGRGLPVLRRIVGRQRNMAVLPDGRVIWPCLSEELIRSSGLDNSSPIRQFQMIQVEPDAVELRLVSERRLQPDEESLIPLLISDAFGWPMRVRIEYVEAIERGPGGKFEDYRCAIPPETIERLKNERRDAVAAASSRMTARCAENDPADNERLKNKRPTAPLVQSTRSSD
jgi:phenylacetate-CoA ligase